MKWSAKVALCLVAGCLVAASASLETKTWFPENPSLEFFPGKAVVAINGVRNAGKDAVNVSAVSAALALVSNPEGFVFNFSGTGYALAALPAGEEYVLEYPLPMPSNIPSRDFILKMFMWINTEGDFQPMMVFNETITVLEESKLVDTELLGLYAILLAMLAAAAYGVLNLAQNKGWVKKPRKSKPVVVEASGDKSEWLKGTVADKALKKKA